ncbi:DUF1146 domain-containing protein [Paenibacillus nanensis]|uniref:DUF1146 domain-containing protein n=2 Tax=Paenibacillus nanensis TaxID=393251 RepID=A0A3A1UXP6_9BACL|nr:DUF1146 domain-containing protein [Paenibacillus nanensis]
MDQMLTMTGLTGVFSITVEILSILLVWMLMREVKWETFFRFPQSPKARMLQLLLAVALGHLFAQFILQYWNYTTMLKSFIE